MTASQRQLHALLERRLQEAFGTLVQRAPGEPALYVALGRIGVRAETEAVGEDNAIVECYSWIARNIPVDNALAGFLARRNAGLRFGALCVDPENAIILRHALFAEAVTQPILTRLIEVMTSTAEEIDTELRGRFG